MESKVRGDRVYQRLRFAALDRGWKYTRVWCRVENGKGYRQHVLIKKHSKPVIFQTEQEVVNWLIERGYSPREPYVTRSEGVDWKYIIKEQ